MAAKTNQAQNIMINTASVVGSTYSQLARVSITDIDITIEFAFVHPADPSNGQSVARITMPLLAGRDLAETILTLNKMRENQQKGKND
jgi:hypothetical protein